MSIFREFNINMIPGKPPLIIHVSQYESDFVYTFNLVSGKSVLAIPDTAIAVIRGTKRDGNGYSVEAALDAENHKVVVMGDVQMTACAGKNVFELAIINDEKVICTANFFLDVERAPLDAGTIQSDSVLRELQAIIDSAATAAQAAEEASASAASAASAAEQAVEEKFEDGVAETIDEWLTDHPEATTTVQDGSLTYKKLVTGTLGFVTPEMFGAVGDGVTDDSKALQDALDSGKPVRLMSKTYIIGNTIEIPDGGSISGTRGESTIRPTCETLFHLSKYNTISSFDIRISSSDVLTIFEADDDSGSSMLADVISNIYLYNELAETPDEFTVCHFHAKDEGYYNIVVEGCTFICNDTNGYVARVYKETPGSGWLSTVLFSNCFTRSFKWHYFFADDDSTVSGEVGRCIVSKCVAQCTEATNGFSYVANNDAVLISDCVTWDWSISENCVDRPYVFKSKNLINNAFFAGIQPYTFGNITFYDGTSFEALPAGRADIISKLHGEYNQDNIPKLVGVGNTKCVQLNHRSSNLPSSVTVIRFYIVNRYGFTEVCISPNVGKVFASKPLGMYKIGTSDNRNYYLHANGSSFYAETALVTIPVNNSLNNISNTQDVLNRLHTIDCAKNFSTSFLSEVPSGLSNLPVVIQRQLYLTGEDGNDYYVTVDSSGNLVAKTATQESQIS